MGVKAERNVPLRLRASSYEKVWCGKFGLKPGDETQRFWPAKLTLASPRGAARWGPKARPPGAQKAPCVGELRRPALGP